MWIKLLVKLENWLFVRLEVCWGQKKALKEIHNDKIQSD